MLKDSKYRFIIFVSIIFISFQLILFFLCLPVHAASAQSYFPMVINENDTISDSTLTAFDNVFGLSDYYWFIGNVPNSSNYYFFRFKKSSSGTVYATISDNGLGHQFSFRIDGSLSSFMSAIRPASGSNVSSSNSGFVFSNLDSSVYNDSISYWSNFPIYTDSTMSTPVLLLEAPVITPDGDPSEPDLDSLDLDSSLNTTIIPSAPTYSNSFNDPVPTYDSSSPVQSLFDIIIYGFNRVHSFFTSFREYLFSWLAYFINLLTYLFQKIIDSVKFIVNWLYLQFLNWLTPYLKVWFFIKDLLFDDDTTIFELLNSFKNTVTNWLNSFWSNSFITYFWDNLTSSLSDIITFFRVVISLGTSNNEFSLITLFSNVIRILFIPDPDDLSDLLVSHDIYGLLDFAEFIQTNINYIKSLLTVNTRSVSYKFTVPDVTIMGVQCGSFDIDFSWYLNYKNVGDPIISAFLIFGWFLWIHARLPYWLRGQQGDVIGFIKEVQK